MDFDGDIDFETTELVIEDKPVTIERVHVDGLTKTKADFIANDLKKMFKSKSFLETYHNAIKSRQSLMKKGIFKDIQVTIDTTDGYDQKKDDGLQVLFKVQEMKNIICEARSEMSSKDKPNWVIRLVSPNVLGRGERLSFSASRALSSTQMYQPSDFNLSFSKPFFNLDYYPPTRLSMSMQQNKHDCLWASYSQCNRGLSAGCDFEFMGNQHHIEVLSQWRELIAGENASMSVRKQAGHSLKTSLLHSMVIDRTDDAILPSWGKSLKISEELALYNSSGGFIKEEWQAKLVCTKLKKFTFELGTHIGALLPFGNLQEINISDKFFIGGPLSLRGFEYNSVGPCDNNSYLGSYGYWLLAGHMYTPLPFYWNEKDPNSWKKNIRLHTFMNAGNCGDLRIMRDSGVKSLYHDARLSCGVGVVYNFMKAARFELNFCYPLAFTKNDKLSEGIQFGIGVSSC